MMNKYKIIVMLALAVLLTISGCSDKVADSNKSNVTIAFKSALGSQSSYFENVQFILTVYTPEDDNTNIYDLSLIDGYIVGDVTVPVGTGRVFTLIVLDITPFPTETLFRGSRTVNIRSGEPFTLDIPMYPQVPMIKLSPIYKDVPVSYSGQGYTFDIDVSVYNIESLGNLSFSLQSTSGSPNLFDLVSTTISPLLAPDFYIEGYNSDSPGEFMFYVSPHTTGNYDMVDDTGYAHICTIRFSARVTESAFDYGLSDIVIANLNPLDSTGNEIDPATIDTLGITINRYNFDALIKGYWQMNEPYVVADTIPLVDGSPNNLTTTAYFTSVNEWSYGNAQTFNGTDSYIEVSDKGELDISDEITISMWLKTDTIPHNTETILSKRNESGGINYEIRHIRTETSENEFLDFAIGGSTHRIPVDFTNGGWHYISVSHKFGSPNETIWVIDGAKATGAWSGTGTDIPSGNFNDMQLGRFPYPIEGGYFAGSIDELKIINKYFDEDYLIQFYTPIGK